MVADKKPRAKSKYKDKLLGLIVRIKVNGKVVKTSASNPKVFQYQTTSED
ncbi:MAG: hypothetical protein ACJAT6_001512 [Akkermansiaceae bacterium]|jgi:hypothetical protein|tara:strand:- start:162 stop:311 length:150 start_codon:yes stop_codon:yes gene_type:complete